MSTVAIQDKFFTVPQAAAIIGVTAGRVRQMLVDEEIKGEQIPAQENGRWLIPEREVRRVADIQQKTGRPRGGQKAG